MLTFVFDAVRALLSFIDKVVYWFLSELIELFDSLASIQLFSDGIIKQFASRIFIFVSIIMIFKVSFSIIQYIINPDNFTDKEKGFSKVIQSVLITLVCLVFVGKIFEFAYSAQKRILDEKVIPSIILGVDKIDSTQQVNAKNELPFLVVSAFFTPNTELSAITYDRNLDVYTCNGIPMYEGKKYNEDFANNCLRSIANPGDNFVAEKYNSVMKNKNFWNLLDYSTTKSTNADVYLFDYKILISTAAGVFIVIMYINFCIDLAIRAAKLGFLQLIAPIPIISMIDPKSSKSGMMSKWVKQCVSTYAGLFIRIAAVNFVVYIIYIITSQDFISNLNTQSQNVFVQILIIFGALMFAKELPKLISDLTGVDLSGSFKLNPLKRIEEAPGGKLVSGAISGTGKALGAVGGHALGAVGHLGMLGAYTLGGGIGGAISGRGFGAGAAKEAKLALNRARRSAIRGLNGGLTNMAGIVGAKPKGINDTSDAYAEEVLKNYKADEEFKREKEAEKARKLYDAHTDNNNNIDYNGLYKNENFRNAVKQMDANKAAMYRVQNDMEALKRSYQPRIDAAKESVAKEYEKLNREYSTAQQEYAAAQQAFERAQNDAYSPISESDARARMEAARTAMETANSNLSSYDYQGKMKAAVENEQKAYTSEYNELQRKVGKYNKDYETAKAEVESLGKRYTEDYKRYKQYTSASDYMSAYSDHSQSNNPPTVPPSGTTPPDPGYHQDDPNGQNNV